MQNVGSAAGKAVRNWKDEKRRVRRLAVRDGRPAPLAGERGGDTRPVAAWAVVTVCTKKRWWGAQHSPRKNYVFGGAEIAGRFNNHNGRGLCATPAMLRDFSDNDCRWKIQPEDIRRRQRNRRCPLHIKGAGRRLFSASPRNHLTATSHAYWILPFAESASSWERHTPPGLASACAAIDHFFSSRGTHTWSWHTYRRERIWGRHFLFPRGAAWGRSVLKYTHIFQGDEARCRNTSRTHISQDENKSDLAELIKPRPKKRLVGLTHMYYPGRRTPLVGITHTFQGEAHVRCE